MIPITTALASFGMSGVVFHAPLLQANEGFKLTGILERTKDESRRLYPQSKLFRSFQEVCDDQDIELVIVNTPDHTHYELTKKALAAGKHVVVEKPFTLQFNQAEELIEIADKSSLVLSVFQNRRWDGDFLTVQQIIREGLLGRLVSFESHFDRYRNYIQEGTWKEEAGAGTGILYNLGSHMLDQALILFGMPESVFADIRALRDESQVDDSFDVWMKYPEVKVLVRASYLVREQGPRYILHGTDGSFLKWGIDPQEEALKAGHIPQGRDWGTEESSEWGLLHTTLEGRDIRERYPTIAGNYQAYYNNVYEAIRHSAPLQVPAREAALVIRVIEAALQSSEENCVISIQK